ncbi:MAG TPA: diguanylate cyclase [Pyrinomonadaceae bacterium]|nr:diguanylate cyclase [Pyrinomonadaceae bacterium]
MLRDTRHLFAASGAAAGLALACALLTVGPTPVAFLLAAVVTFEAVFLYKTFERHSRRALDEEGRRRREAERASELRLRAIESLAMAIDAKDQTTPGHVRRTRLYATELGKLLSVTPAEMEALGTGALLHDVGKLAVPDHILNKPGKLSPAEFEKMKTHAEVGGDIVRRIDFPFPVEDAVRHHHERWDGGGYPSGLRGEQIPLVARVIAVVDFYDSSRCERPFRAGHARDESIELLRRKSGTHFDPRVVEAFITHVASFDRLIAPEDLAEQVSSQVSSDGAAAEAGRVTDSRVAADATPRAEASGFRSIAEAQREVYALHEIIQAVASSLNVEDTVALVADRLRRLIPFDDCVVYLVDERTGAARAAHAFGANAEAHAGRAVPVGEGVTGWVVANARTMRSRSPELDLAGLTADAVSRLSAVTSAPLAREDGAFGAITLYTSVLEEYTAEHARLLETVCRHVEGALANAVAYERSRLSALTDPLTELPNARSLYATLEQRLAECHRSGSEPLSLLVMNLDDFRQLNERHGHGVGDRLLAGFARVVKNQLRQMDTLARFEGDEFVAVLPTATGEVARTVAERVRAAVESHKFTARKGREAHLRVSCGVASFPHDGETTDALLASAADEMRYQKHARKVAAGTLAAGGVAHFDAHR